MLVATLPGPSREDVEKQIFNYTDKAEVLELRPDLYSFENFNWIHHENHQPFLIAGGPELPCAAFVDIPFEKWTNVPTQAKKICSYHNYQSTPHNLDQIFEEMLSCPAYVYKIVTKANSALDGFRMLRLVRAATTRGIPIVGHCMGDAGEFTRILGKVMGNFWTYCTVGEPVAPGQMTLDEMRSIYHIDKLDQATQIYALIGDPVTLSRGHQFHNNFFAEKNINAVYVKIPLKPDELQEGLVAAQKLGFKGLSVTMPLKEIAGSLCEPPIPVCNTITFKNGVGGFNTDGEAALSLLKQRIDLNGKRALLVGYGGLGKEIASQLLECGVETTILNRTYGGAILPLNAWETLNLDQYAMIIQTTQVGMGNPDAAPVDWNRLSPQHLVLEAVSNPVETALVRAARVKGCQLITGKELFEEQACRQHKHWGISHA